MDYLTQPVTSAPMPTVAMPRATKGMTDAQVEKAAKDFEAVLLQKLMDEMRATVDDSGLLEDGAAGQQVQGIFWSYLAQDVSQKGGMGLWKEISRQMKASEAAERRGAEIAPDRGVEVKK